MPLFDPIEFVLDSDDGVSSTMGTETLATHDLVPEDTPNQPFRSQGLSIRLVHGRRYLDNRHSTFHLVCYEHQPLGLGACLGGAALVHRLSFCI
jgi:hypothetical protein